MLWKLRELRTFSLRAEDGEIGRVDELLVNDESWVVRYVVVDAGDGTPGKRVLISPVALATPNGAARVLPVSLTREQVKRAPLVDAKEPVSRHRERQLHDYYGWPYYWVGGPMWGPFLTPGELARTQVDRSELPPVRDPAEPPPNPHLRSTKEIEGYHFEARDGELGHVEDFIVDDRDYRVRYLEIDTRNWWPGKKVLLPIEHAREVKWDERIVHADVERKLVKEAPKYDESATISPELEREMAKHYGLELSVVGYR